MAECSLESDSNVDFDVENIYSEEENIRYAFIESLEVLEENGEEFYLQLSDAIAEVEGVKSFPCDKCEKICKFKGGLTRHRRSKHEELETTPTASQKKKSKNKMPAIEMNTIKEMCKEIGDKIREEKLYPEAIIKIVSSLTRSKEFVKYINDVFSKFRRKRNQDSLLASFYGEILKNWKKFFPGCDNQSAVNVLLIHFPQKVISHLKQSSDLSCEQESEEIKLNPEELGPLSYVAGYVLHSMHKKSKNSPHWNSQRSIELQSLLTSVKLEDVKEDEYINSISRGGLWAPNDNIKGIAKETEIVFRKHIRSSKAVVTISIPTEKIVDEILMQPVIISLWENITTGLDFDISSECSKLALENFVKLFIQVRSFSHAKGIVNRYKLKSKKQKTKALRTELKKMAEEK